METKNTETVQTCNTCCRAADAPYRSYDQAGKIVQGCVDVFHTASLSGIICQSTQWHGRPEAKKIRAANKTWLRELTK